MSEVKYFNPYNQFTGAWIPNWLLKRKELSADAKILYARLAQFNGKDGDCRPSNETLIEETAIPKRRLVLALNELKNHKLIERKRRGRGLSNVYFFLVHEWQDGKKRKKQDDPPLDQQKPLDDPPLDQQDDPGVGSTRRSNGGSSILRESFEENHIRDSFSPSADGGTNGKTQTNMFGKNVNNGRRENQYTRILEHWNDKQIIVHKKEPPPCDNMKYRKIVDRITEEGATEPDIYRAIDNYARVLHSLQHFWHYKWTLSQFLKRGGVEKFQDWDFVDQQYRNNGKIKRTCLSIEELKKVKI